MFIENFKVLHIDNLLKIQPAPLCADAKRCPYENYSNSFFYKTPLSVMLISDDLLTSKEIGSIRGFPINIYPSIDDRSMEMSCKYLC